MASWRYTESTVNWEEFLDYPDIKRPEESGSNKQVEWVVHPGYALMEARSSKSLSASEKETVRGVWPQYWESTKRRLESADTANLVVGENMDEEIVNILVQDLDIDRTFVSRAETGTLRGETRKDLIEYLNNVGWADHAVNGEYGSYNELDAWCAGGFWEELKDATAPGERVGIGTVLPRPDRIDPESDLPYQREMS
jgi:hypothetical protein